MEWNKQNVKSLLTLICGGILFYVALQHLSSVVHGILWIFSILSPFLLGGAIAFILNVPMRFMERGLFPHAPPRAAKFRRPLALVLTLAVVIGVLTLASVVIVPNLGEAFQSIAQQIPAALKRAALELERLEQYLPALQTYVQESNLDWTQLSQKALSIAQSWGTTLLSSGGGLIGGVVSGVGTFFIGLVFSFYVLLQKERLSRQARQCAYALFPQRAADRGLEILRLSNRIFSHFLSGQCLEAVILGSMFVVAMTILRMPYALLVGVLIALTALIPIVGAFIGCAVGALLILLVDPWKALLFIVLFLVLQQVEGNLIYPHVVGSSVGLPSIWVLAAVTLGGKLMGITGMLFFIPLCSVLYTLFRGFIKERLRLRSVPAEKWRDPPNLPHPPAPRPAKSAPHGKKKP